MLENHPMKDKIFYLLHTDYAFTMTPSDKYQFYSTQQPIQRIKKFRNFLYTLLVIDFPGSIKLKLEVSEPYGEMRNGYSGPRLHVHGTICFAIQKHLCKFMLTTLPSILKTSDIKIGRINDKVIWNNYVEKQNIIPKKLSYMSSYDIQDTLGHPHT